MSNNSSNSSTSEDERDIEENMVYEVFMQEINTPISHRLRRFSQQSADVGSSSNTRAKRRYIEREREVGEDRIMRDYFCDNPVYTDFQFRTRFRMKKHLFLRIVRDIENRCTYFQSRNDATGRRSFSALHKCTIALRMLAYGCSADMLDENVRMAKGTIIQCLREFVRAVREIYSSTYLRRPDANDVARLLRIGERRGFPGMLGSIDCMHWEWKNCPVAWHGTFTRGDIKAPTIILEAVASADLWIWHAFFGVAGSNNDLNVLNQSSLFTQQLRGQAPPVHYQVNHHAYSLGYYLADGIYPQLATFVKTIPLPQTDKHKLFAEHQESARKDVERAFGVLQSRFTIVRGPVRIWDQRTIGDIMYACIILHNMIVKDERDEYTNNYDCDYEGLDGVRRPTMEDVDRGAHPRLQADILRANANIHDRQIHHRLQEDLVEHIW